MALFGDIASTLGGLFGGSQTLGSIGQIGDIGLGAFDLYQGFQNTGRTNDYLNALYGSQELSDSLLKEQAERAKTFYPLEDLQAQYAIEDMKTLRPLQTAQQGYGLTRGMSDIDLAQSTIDPTRTGLIQQLAQGAPAQRFMDIASANVQQASDQALADTQRAYARQGMNPNSGASQGLLSQFAIQKAAAEAGARTEAGRIAEDLDISRKGQAINLFEGIPLPQTQSTISGTALASKAASGFNEAAMTLGKSANLTSGLAENSFAGATSLFKGLGGYLQPAQQQQQQPTPNLVSGNSWSQF